MLIDPSGLARGLPAIEACGARLEVGSAAEATGAEPVSMAAGHIASPTVPAEWFRDHVSTLWRLVGRLGVPARNIEDVVQEVFIIACRRRADIPEDRVRSFLFGTAIRLCKNYKRRAYTRLEVSRDEAVEPSASQQPD